MDFSAILTFLMGLSPIVGYVLMGLGTLVVLGYCYIKITPTQADDAWWAKVEAIPILGALLKALVALAPIKRKDE